MPNPTQSDLHINVPLTNVSVAYIQKSDVFIADKVFPRVPVEKQSDAYYKYSKSDWRRTQAQRRAPGTESVGVGWNMSMDTYFAHVYAVHKDIDDQTRANADSIFKLDADATSFVTNQLLLKRDIDWAAAYFKTGVWGSDLALSSAASTSDMKPWDLSTSDPIMLMANQQINFIQNTGYKANTLVLGAATMKALKNHPAIIDRIKYTQKGIVSTDLLATLFDVDNIYVSLATTNNGPEVPDMKAQDAAGSNAFIADPKSALLCYTAATPSLMQPTAGYVFTWKGYTSGNSQGIRIFRFRQDAIRSDRIEAEMTYDMKVVSKDMGVFMTGVVS